MTIARYNKTKTDNAWSGLVDVWMCKTPRGEYVKYTDIIDVLERVRLLDVMASKLGYASIEEALLDLEELGKLSIEHKGD